MPDIEGRYVYKVWDAEEKSLEEHVVVVQENEELKILAVIGNADQFDSYGDQVCWLQRLLDHLKKQGKEDWLIAMLPEGARFVTLEKAPGA